MFDKLRVFIDQEECVKAGNGRGTRPLTRQTQSYWGAWQEQETYCILYHQLNCENAIAMLLFYWIIYVYYMIIILCIILYLFLKNHNNNMHVEKIQIMSPKIAEKYSYYFWFMAYFCVLLFNLSYVICHPVWPAAATFFEEHGLVSSTSASSLCLIVYGWITTLIMVQETSFPSFTFEISLNFHFTCEFFILFYCFQSSFVKTHLILTMQNSGLLI